MFLRASILVALLAPATWAQASFTGLAVFGVAPPPIVIERSVATAVSADGGVVVGSTSTPQGILPFHWNAVEGMVLLRDPAGRFLTGGASSVSADGAVIAGDGSTINGQRVFRWKSGAFTEIGPSPVFSSGYTSSGIVSGDGLVIAGYNVTLLPCDEAFRWTESGGLVSARACMRPRALNHDGSVIVGEATVSEFPQALRLTVQTLESLSCVDPPAGPIDQTVRAVTPSGHMAVGYCGGGAMWAAGDPPILLHSAFQPYGISGAGTVVVGQGGFTGRAAIWDQFNGVRDLQSVLESDFGLSTVGWTLSVATAISTDGSTIVGQGTDPCGRLRGWVVRLSLPMLPTCPADIDGDQRVTLTDLTVLLARFGTASNCGDTNADGVIDTPDLIRLLGSFGRACFPGQP